MSRTIVVKNLSTVLKDSEVRKALPALQKQLSRDIAPLYGGGGHLEFAKKDESPGAGDRLFYLFDNADQAGVDGYHDLGSDGQPLAKVFVKTTIDDGGVWTVTASHELGEMAADPNINTMAFDEEHGRLYCFEICDAPEADEFGYRIGDVLVSDFVLPSWFEPTHVTTGEKFAFRSPITAPFQLLPGGYIAFFDLHTKEWKQITARAHVNAREMRSVHEHADVTPLNEVPNRGPRRIKRSKPRADWKHSTAP